MGMKTMHGQAKLSARLAAVACHVPAGAAVADIGTDHAYLPLYLVGQGIARRVVAGEVGPGPYDTARGAVRAAGLEKQVEVRLGDGLQVLAPGEVEVVVLAGMGGRTICRVLAEGRPVLERLDLLILQPMRDAALVRRWLWENRWRLVDEDMVYEDGHYYVVLVARPGADTYNGDEISLELGPRLLEKRDAVFMRYLARRHDEIIAVLQELSRAKGAQAAQKAARLQREAGKIEEVLGKWLQRPGE